MTSIPDSSPHSSVAKEDQWLLVAKSKQVSHTPFTVQILGIPLLIIRLQERLICIEDRCPHRGFPLSKGKFESSDKKKHDADSIVVQCAYHGWRFDVNFNSHGNLIEIPGAISRNKQSESKLTSTAVKTNCLKHFPIKENDGDIWVKIPGTAPVNAVASHRDYSNLKFSSMDLPDTGFPDMDFACTNYPYMDFHDELAASPIDIMENFLDALHTHYVHSGIVRSKVNSSWANNSNVKRHKCKVHVESITKGYQATYIEERQQSGFLNKAFGGHIVKSIGRVLLPGYVQIEYCSKDAVEMQVCIWISPVSKNINKVSTRTYLKPGKLPFLLKAVVLYPIMRYVYRQDKQVLETLARNIEHSCFHPMIVESDIMRHCIAKVLANDITPVDKTIEIEL